MIDVIMYSVTHCRPGEFRYLAIRENLPRNLGISILVVTVYTSTVDFWIWRITRLSAARHVRVAFTRVVNTCQLNTVSDVSGRRTHAAPSRSRDESLPMPSLETEA